MKLLLDENLPSAMRWPRQLTWDGPESRTVSFCRRRPRAGFEILITNDRGLEYEQNLINLPLAIVVLLAKANTIEAMRPLYPKLFAALATIRRGDFVKVAE